MPAPFTPATAGSIVPPPIATAPIVNEGGYLTPLGLNFLQKLWAAIFGGGGISSLTIYPGCLQPYGGGIVPSGWLLCDGSSHLIADFPALYAAIGATWGAAAPGQFKVPNGQDKFLFGASGSHPLGSSGGALSRTIAQANLPNISFPVTDSGHVHSVTDPGHTHGITDPGHHHSGGFSPTTTNTSGSATGTGTAANTGDSVTGISVSAATTGLSVNNHATGISVASGGSGTALDTTPPYIAVNWLIKT